MKKIGLILAPLLSVLFLTNCGSVKYKVIFDSKGGSYVPTQEVEENNCATKPNDPTKESTYSKNFTFCDWRLNGAPYDFNTPVTKDITLEATWISSTKCFSVTFDSNGGTPVDPIEVEFDTPIGEERRPINPTKDSTAEWKFNFDDWYRVKEDGTMEKRPFDFVDTPIIENVVLKAKWSQVKQKYTIKFFDEDRETKLDIIEDIEYGRPIVYGGGYPTKDPTFDTTYTFAGWNPELKPGDIVTGDQEYFATYTASTRLYLVDFDSDGGTEIHTQEVPCYKYATPPTEEMTKQDAYCIYNFDNWYKVKEDGEMEDTAFDFENTQITSNITLKAKWNIKNRKRYLLVRDPLECKNLHFTTLDDRTLLHIEVEAGVDFQFNLEALMPSYSNDSGNVIPSELNIFIGDSGVPLSPGHGYKIDIIDGSHNTKAIVTIDGDKICDKITINGGATPVNYYKFTFEGFGVGYDPIDPYQLINQDLNINLKKVGTYALPAPENIYINVDGGKWISLSSAESASYCEYNQTTGILKIIKNSVNSSIDVRARSRSYNLLEDYTWKQINDFCQAGWASSIFYIGETKKVSVNGVTHTVRIIDFNHDTLKDGKNKAALTFEFVELLSSANGVAMTSKFSDRNNWCYGDNSINIKLNTDKKNVYGMLPSELQNCIKIAKKITGKGTQDGTKKYDVKLFPLAYSEITGKTSNSRWEVYNEGPQYAYYKTITNYKKCPVGSRTAQNYWTRSCCKSYQFPCYNVSDKGVLNKDSDDSRTDFDYSLAFTAAFCI